MESNVFQLNVSFTQEQVNEFARVTGDINPLHLDDSYAKNTFFKQKIIHGFLAGSVFSKIFGTIFPGEGTIYLKQELKFLRPMYVDVLYTVKIKVIDIYRDKKRAKMKTQIFDSSNQITIDGEALIQNEIYG